MSQWELYFWSAVRIKFLASFTCNLHTHFDATHGLILPTFPSSIEEWWWKEALKRWPEMSEDKLLNLLRQEIVKQSDRFNKFREFDADAYGKRDLSILAYGNFYFSRTWTAMTFAMAEAHFFVVGILRKKGLFEY